MAIRSELAEWARAVVNEAGGLSLRQIEIRTGVGFTTVQNLLNGRVVESGNIIRFANAFHKSVPEALRIAGYEDIADLWQRGAYAPAPDSPPIEEPDDPAIDEGSYGELIRGRRAMGRRIRARMEAVGMQQGDLARLLGKTQPTISGYLAGRHAIDAVELARIARVLQIPVAQLFGEDELLDEDADGNRPRLVAFYDDLTPDGQDDLLAIAETVWKRKRRQDPVIGRKAE